MEALGIRVFDLNEVGGLSLYVDGADESNHRLEPVSYTHLRAHETVLDLVCRLLLDKKTQHLRYLQRLVTASLQTLLHRLSHQYASYPSI